MKKSKPNLNVLILLLLLTLTLLLTACTTEAPDTTEPGPRPPTTQEQTAWEPSDDLTEQQLIFMYDLSYMLYILENNFASLDVAHWAYDLDIHQSVNSIRQEVIQNPDMDVDDFFVAISQKLTASGLIGFLNTLNPVMHANWLTGNAPGILRQDNVMEFYRPRHPEEPEDDYARAYRILTTHGEGSIQHFVRRLELVSGEADLASDILRARDEGDISLATNLAAEAFRLTVDAPAMHTEIIEDGRIAYLGINWFDLNRRIDVLNFYEEIRGFEHLIIDIRAVETGDPRFFFDVIMRPNLRGDVTINGFGFAIGGEYVQNVLNPLRLGREIFFFDTSEFGDATDIVANHDLPELALWDIERMTYGFRLEKTLTPDHIGGRPAFNGKIWLLTGPNTIWGAQLATWVSSASEFATHVGEPSGGNFGGGVRSFAALPLTGILIHFEPLYITDEQGWPLEAGTAPHHLNYPGLNALETALVLIEEGQY